jgi:hypothetical protein
MTIRIGDEMRDDIAAAVNARNKAFGNQKIWTLTEFVVQAIVDKLNHDLRGKRQALKKVQEKIDDNMPREYREEDL